MRALHSVALAIGLLTPVGCGGNSRPGAATNQSHATSSTVASEPKIAPSANLDGTYSVLKMYFQGKWVFEEEIKAMQGSELVAQFKGDTMTDKAFGVEATRTFKIDPSKSPAEIDFYPKGSTIANFAIYKIEGDTLTLCMGGSNRPKEFTPNERVLIMLLKKRRSS